MINVLKINCGLLPGRYHQRSFFSRQASLARQAFLMQLADCHSELCPQDTNCVRPITAVKYPLHENSPKSLRNVRHYII